MARFLHGSIPERDRREFLEDFILADFDAALGTALTAVSKESADAMPQEYRQLPVSTLLISGEYDQIISADMGKQAAALNPKVQHKVVANTGHFPMLEDSTTYMQYLQDFLQDT
jgi:proline iminopeptidase